MACRLLARTAVVVVAACSALTAGLATAGAAAADPDPDLHANVRASSAAVFHSPVFADHLGRKLK